MRTLAALCFALLAVAVRAQSPSPEAISLGSERAFLSLPHSIKFKPAPRAFRAAKGPVSAAFLIEDPRPRPARPGRRLGEAVGQVSLPALLDHHRDLLPGQRLGDHNWDISVAGNAGFKSFFVTFQQPGRLEIRPLGDLNRLRGEGVNIAVEPGVVYNFRASINIFNPVRGSTLEIHPVQGTRGPSYDHNTGKILDLAKAKAYVFAGNDQEYWVLHGTDVDPQTNKLADTRSLLFIHEAGLSSKMWPVAESALPVGQPTSVTFGDYQYILTRSASGQLTISTAE